MGILYVTEYQFASAVGPGQTPMPIAVEPPVASQTVSYTTTTQSNAFNVLTSFVRIHTDSICSIEFGTNPTATTSKRRMVAGATEYFAVPPGESYKVAAVTNT